MFTSADPHIDLWRPLPPGASSIDLEHLQAEMQSDHATSLLRCFAWSATDGPLPMTPTVVLRRTVERKRSKVGSGRRSRRPCAS